MDNYLELEELIRTTEAPHDAIKVRGFFRVQIEDPEKGVVGDSGWKENQVVNLGYNEYLVKALGTISGSLNIQWCGLGTGTQPGAADTTLQGEIQKRTSFTAATSNTSKALNIVGTFLSAGSFCTTTQNISNIGMWNSSNAGTLFCGNTYASSSCASNQNVNFSYVINFT